MLVSAVIIAIHINRSLALIIAVAIPVLAISILLYSPQRHPAFHLYATENGSRQCGCTGKPDERAGRQILCAEKFEKKKFAVFNDDLRAIAVRASGTVVMVMPAMQLVMNVSIVAILGSADARSWPGPCMLGN